MEVAKPTFRISICQPMEHGAISNMALPVRCPQTADPRIKFAATGTQMSI